MKPKEENKIPKTGRIGRFAKIVEKKASRGPFLKIMEKSIDYGKYKPGKKAQWWSNTIDILENELGAENAIEVMNACGSKCCGQGQRRTAKRLMTESPSIEGFLEKVSKHGVKEGELEYKLIDENTIIGKYYRCFCGQVKKSNKPFKSDTYCQCSAEFNKRFFEAAFDKTVEVELKQSILNGDDFCEFEINLKI